MKHPYRLCFASTILLTCSSAVFAQSSYELRHDYKLRLNANANEEYRGAWRWYSRAKAVSHRDGTDNGTPVIQSGNGTFTPPSMDFNNCKATRIGASAYSETFYNAALNGTGYHEVYGRATCTSPDGMSARAESGSALGLNIGARNRRGDMFWRPTWIIDSIQGGAAGGIDPIDFEVFDLDTGGIQTARFWDTGIDFDGAGTSTWANGNLHIDGANGSFFLNMDSPFLTSGTGSIAVTFVNGFVTNSDDSGVFDGILPSIGESSLGFDLGIGDPTGEIMLSFDFGADNVNGFDIGASFGSSGFAQATPEPATWFAMGMGALAVMRRRRK